MSFLGKDNILWFDNKLVTDREANISVMSHTLHYGTGVFEGVRAFETAEGPAVFRLADHTRRFLNSARMLKMDIPFDYETLYQAQKDVVKHNNFSSCYIRPMAFYGAASLGVFPHIPNKVHVVIAAWQWGNYFNSLDNDGISVTTSTFRRHHHSSVLTKAKVSGHYVNSMLALQEAKARGYQEAVLFDANGYVAEGSSANIFLVKNGVLYTPTDAAILLGITRDSIIHLASDDNIKVVEKNLTRDELYLADEIFFTGTAADVSPVIAVDDYVVGTGKPGAITKRIIAAYKQAVSGQNQRYPAWNALV